MESKLKQDIDTYGGKHGALLRLQDTELADNIVPFLLINPKEGISEVQKQQLTQWIGKFGADQVIIRTSHSRDWNGLVDVMPTKVSHLDFATQTIEGMYQELSEDDLRIYANEEGVSFRPEDCSFSIAPYVGKYFTTITEHPNTPEEMLMVDDYVGHMFEAFDYFRGEAGFERETHPALLNTRKKFRELGLIEDNASLQYEVGLTKEGKALIYQVKKFADRVVNELYADQEKQNGSSNSRWFGSTYAGNQPKMIPGIGVSGIGPLLTRERIRVKDIARFEQEEDKQYLLVNEVLSEMHAEYPLRFPKNMRAYIGRNPALGHMHTRYVQRVLQQPQGSATLLRSQHDIDGILHSVSSLIREFPEISHNESLYYEMTPLCDPMIIYGGS